MIRDCPELREFRKRRLRSEPPDYWRNLHLLEAMYEEARALGVFPRLVPRGPSDALLKMVRVIHGVSGTA
jgi:hypothetical protein